MNERELEVFKIIINHYLDSGESVGSRTLEKKYNMGVSSATIRNVMSDLEEMGLIMKTHTSSGRVPTLDGYKKYIEELLQVEEVNEDIREHVFNVYQKRINKTDTIFKETVKLLSEISSATAFVLEPSASEEDIKKIQFIQITDKDVFVVAVMKNNIVKTSNLTMNTYITEESINKLNVYIDNLIQTTHKKFTLKDLERFLKSIGDTNFQVGEKKIFENNKVFIDGKENILNKEVFELDKTIDIIKLLNDNNEMRNIFNMLAANSEYNTEKASVVFGKDLKYSSLEDCVFIFQCYEFGNEKGILGVIGQTRIDYSKIVGMIEMVINMLKKMLNQNVEKICLGYKD